MDLYQRNATLAIAGTPFAGRFSFKIEVEPNGAFAKTSEIRAYNLSPAHRDSVDNALQNAQGLVLFAGYGKTLKMLYTGTVFQAESQREGSDVVTTMSCSSQLATLRKAYVSFSGATSDWDIYTLCMISLEKLGLAQGYVSKKAENLLRNARYQRGSSDVGYVAKLLDAITQRNKLHWGIHNTAVNLYFIYEYADSSELTLSKDNGMIGIPSKNKQNQYLVRSLLNADLVPGKKISIHSQQLQLPGDLLVNKATHVGDTYEGDWYSEAECVVLGFAPDYSGGQS